MRAVMVALSAGPKVTPMDLMLAVMRDPRVALDMRVTMALKALPRLHRKLRAGESPSHVGDQSLPIENLSTHERRVSMGGSVSEAAGIKSEKSSSGARTSERLADLLIPGYEGANGTGLKPLPFLLAVLNDDKTPAAIKLKVASATMPYTHPRRSTRPAQPSVATDRFGFTVEPALARKLRNEIARFSVLKKRRNPHPRDRETIQKLNEKLDAKFATLQSPCPSGYSAQQAATDKEKIEYLWRKRRSRRKLTPNEDAALAHINARYCAFVSGPEARARGATSRAEGHGANPAAGEPTAQSKRKVRIALFDDPLSARNICVARRLRGVPGADIHFFRMSVRFGWVSHRLSPACLPGAGEGSGATIRSCGRATTARTGI
jgi:hypothetical protein